MPRFEVDDAGLDFTRLHVEGHDLGNLTLPRTFFSRCRFQAMSFRNTDLSESVLCWNDFIEVDFSSASLARADLRLALFELTSFRDADLRGADLRAAGLELCHFDGADMDGAIVSRRQLSDLLLTRRQRRLIDVREDDGPEPDGG